MLEIFRHSIHPALQIYLGPPDPVTSKWPFLDSPLAIVATLSAYCLIICFLKKHMDQRKPYELRSLLVIYNIFQVLLSAYICKEVLFTAIDARYNLSCEPVNTSTPHGFRMAKAFWIFYISKIIDLMDTVFFVLRKKIKQITFLHMYHHSSMIFNWYLGVLYSPGGQAFFSVMLNSFVHVIMYTYYMLAALGPKAHKYLWWKKYLTQIQMTQFLLVNIHLFVGLYNHCRAPFWLNCFTITYVSTLVVLFGNFYFQAYKKKTVTKPFTSTSSKYLNKDIDYKAAGDYLYNKED